MSNRRKRRPNRKPSGRQRPRQARSAQRPPRKPRFPQELGYDAYRMMGLSTALGADIAHKAVEILDRYWDRMEIRGIDPDGTVNLTFHFPEPDGAVLTTILDIVRDFEVVSKSADPERRTWDAIVQLGKLDAMVTRLKAAA